MVRIWNSTTILWSNTLSDDFYLLDANTLTVEADLQWNKNSIGLDNLSWVHKSNNKLLYAAKFEGKFFKEGPVHIVTLDVPSFDIASSIQTDLKNGTVLSGPLMFDPRDSSNQYVYALANNGTFLANPNYVYRIDMTTGTSTLLFSVPDSSQYLIEGAISENGLMFVPLMFSDGDVTGYMIDIDTAKSTSIPYSITYPPFLDSDYLYCFNDTSSELIRVSLSNLKEKSTSIPVPPFYIDTFIYPPPFIIGSDTHLFIVLSASPSIQTNTWIGRIVKSSLDTPSLQIDDIQLTNYTFNFYPETQQQYSAIGEALYGSLDHALNTYSQLMKFN